MAADYLALGRVAYDGADLALGVDGVDAFACLDVPHSHCFVGSAASGDQQISLPWAPG